MPLESLRNQDTVRSRLSNLRLYEDGTNRLSLSMYLNHADVGHARDSVTQSTVRSARSALGDYPNSVNLSGNNDPSLEKSPVSFNGDFNEPFSPSNDPFDADRKDPNKDIEISAIKLGTLKGVFFPCVQNILGIILFVRLGWITGVAGIGFALLICLLATLSTFVTCLSLAAISTNGKIPAGGVYYMISRSLGPKWGGSVGLLFYLSNVCASVLYVLGAIEILTTYLLPGMSIGSNATNARIYGTVVVLILASIVLVGISLVNRTAVFFLAAVIIAILSSLVGIFASNRPNMPQGVTGFPGNFASNWGPHYGDPDVNGQTSNENFFSLFGIFYPSVTGIMAGSNRSGNLKNPARSIPIGTLAAQLTTTAIYVVFIMLLGTVVTGPLLRTKTPDSGLLVASVAWPHALVVTLGCLFASLGAGLQCFVGAPRLLQAIAKDEILPFLHYFIPLSSPVYIKVRGHSLCLHKGGEPRRALLLTLVIAEGITLIGSLDVVAPVVTMLYLICYLFVNLSTTLLGFLKEPNWRPTWRFYHWSVSFIGATICLVYMFLLNWYVALIALFVMLCLYFYIEYRGAKVSWGDGIESFHIHMAQQNLIGIEKQQTEILLERKRKRQKLLKKAGLKFKDPGFHFDDGSSVFDGKELKDTDSESESANDKVQELDELDDGDHTLAKNWRPQIVVFLDYTPEARRVMYPNVLAFVSQLRKGGGLSIVTACIHGEFEALSTAKIIDEAKSNVRLLCREYKTDSFTDVLVSTDLVQGILVGVQSSGLGVLRPNTVLLPFPTNSKQFSRKEADDFVALVRGIIVSDKALLLLKNPHLFPVKAPVRSGTLDVYWILHDGGILTLIPYLLRKHRVWRNTGLRIFAIAQLDDNSVAMKAALVETLNALRIEYVSAEVLELGNFDVSEFAYEKTVRMVERQNKLRKMSKIMGHGQPGILINAAATSLKEAQPQKAEGMPNSGVVVVNPSVELTGEERKVDSHYIDLSGSKAEKANGGATAIAGEQQGSQSLSSGDQTLKKSFSGPQEWLKKIKSKSVGSRKDFADLAQSITSSPSGNLPHLKNKSFPLGPRGHILRFPSESIELQQWPKSQVDGSVGVSSVINPTELPQEIVGSHLEMRRGYLHRQSNSMSYNSSDESVSSTAELLRNAAPEGISRSQKVGVSSYDKDSDKSCPSLPLSDEDMHTSSTSLASNNDLSLEAATPGDRLPANLANLFNQRDAGDATVRTRLEGNTPAVKFQESPTLNKGVDLMKQRMNSIASLVVPDALQELHCRALEKNRVEMMDTAIKLNKLMRKHSKEAALVMINLPAPSPNQQSLDWVEYIDVLTFSIERVVLVNGTGSEVVTAFF